MYWLIYFQVYFMLEVKIIAISTSKGLNLGELFYPIFLPSDPYIPDKPKIFRRIKLKKKGFNLFTPSVHAPILPKNKVPDTKDMTGTSEHKTIMYAKPRVTNGILQTTISSQSLAMTTFDENEPHQTDLSSVVHKDEDGKDMTVISKPPSQSLPMIPLDENGPLQTDQSSDVQKDEDDKDVTVTAKPQSQSLDMIPFDENGPLQTDLSSVVHKDEDGKDMTVISKPPSQSLRMIPLDENGPLQTDQSSDVQKDEDDKDVTVTAKPQSQSLDMIPFDENGPLQTDLSSDVQKDEYYIDKATTTASNYEPHLTSQITIFKSEPSSGLVIPKDRDGETKDLSRTSVFDSIAQSSNENAQNNFDESLDINSEGVSVQTLTSGEKYDELTNAQRELYRIPVIALPDQQHEETGRTKEKEKSSRKFFKEIVDDQTKSKGELHRSSINETSMVTLYADEVNENEQLEQNFSEISNSNGTKNIQELSDYKITTKIQLDHVSVSSTTPLNKEVQTNEELELQTEMNKFNTDVDEEEYLEENDYDTSNTMEDKNYQNDHDISTTPEYKSINKSENMLNAEFMIIPEHGDHFAHEDDDTNAADTLKRKIKVLCWVMTYPANHEKAARHVKRTWGKRCNILVFMSTEEDLTLPAVELPVKEGYHFLWGKTREAFKYIYDYYLHDADWFLKADDDTYVVLENLRFMLAKYDTKDAIYFGFQKKGLKQTYGVYMDGGAGYVLSKEAVIRFVEEALPNPYICRKNPAAFAEDAEIAECLRRVNVKLIDTRDSYKRARFFPCPPHTVVRLETPDYFDNAALRTPKGRSCCSEYAISFHHLKPNMMYVLEYFMYHLRPYGITYDFHFHIEHKHINKPKA